MSKLANIAPFGGSLHPFRFKVSDAEGAPAFVNLDSNPGYYLPANQITRPLDEVAFYIGGRVMTLPVNEQRFGYPDDPSGQKIQQLREIAAFNRRGIERDQPELQIVVGSPLSAVSAYAIGIGRYERVVPYGWSYKFSIADQIAEGVYVPKPQPQQKVGQTSRYKTELPSRITKLYNGMIDEAVIGGVELPRTPQPIKLLTEITELGHSADGIRFVEGRVVRLLGLKLLETLPDNASILVYSEVYRRAQALKLPPQILERLFVGGSTFRNETHNQLPQFGSLNKIHPYNVRQACEQGI